MSVCWKRWSFGFISLLLSMAAYAQLPASGRWANGVIVKLKSQVGSTVAAKGARAQASTLSFESSTRVRSRLSGLALRQRVAMAGHRSTAFAAHVLHGPRVTSLTEAEAQAARLRRDPDVEWAIPNAIEKPATFAGTSDPYLSSQRWLGERGLNTQGVAGISAAWDRLDLRATPLNPVVVALLDTGTLPHPDLAGRFLPGYDFVSVAEYSRDHDGLDADPTDPGSWLTEPERRTSSALYGDCDAHDSTWHGLAIAGMLAANTNNGEWGAGILAPLQGPVILPVRVAGTCGAEVSDIVEGMLWAAGVPYQGSPAMNPHPARVVNLSFGGDGTCADTGSHDVGWLYRQTVATLKSRGVLVVASAGNGGDNGGLAEPTRPASCAGVLAVTALHERGFKASYANLVGGTGAPALAVIGGDENTLSSWGGGILTTYNSGLTVPNPSGYGLEEMIGTSFSAPIVAGVAALMLAVDPHLTVDELVNGLTSTATPHLSSADRSIWPLPDLPQCEPGQAMAQCYCTNTTCGAGRLDADAAVAFAIDHAQQFPSGSGSSGPASLDAAFFTPTRVQSTNVSRPSSGGGGGALDPSSLAVLALMMWLTLIGGGRR
ncbi:MAG: S8 family serine peptidase [Aquabacterium sp.]|nr:S8 family serine peptidase [Aquabacterium sp.]